MIPATDKRPFPNLSPKPFPIPVAVVGAGSQGDEAPDYLAMPNEMGTFALPGSPEDADPLHVAAAAKLLSALADRMDSPATDAHPPVLDLLALPSALRDVLGQSLGFGEVSAFTTGPNHWRVQETAFTGLWRILKIDGQGEPLADRLEVAAIPDILIATMRANTASELPPPDLPTGVMNAAALIEEIRLQAAAWRQGEATHTINLTLLPMSDVDLDVLYAWLGHREVSILSRGYGNCRITSTRLVNVWWVQYFNSMDVLILNSIEITDMPDVAKASAEDLEDAIPRLREYIASLAAE